MARRRRNRNKGGAPGQLAAPAPLDATPERMAHHARAQGETLQDAAPRPASGKPRALISPMARLLARGSITQRQYDAGDRLYRAWALGICGAREVNPDRLPGTAPPPWMAAGLAQRQLDAATDYRCSMRALGKALSAIAVAVAIEELTVDAYAKRRLLDIKTARGYLLAALDRLADDHQARGDMQRQRSNNSFCADKKARAPAIRACREI